MAYRAEDKLKTQISRSIKAHSTTLFASALLFLLLVLTLQVSAGTVPNDYFYLISGISAQCVPDDPGNVHIEVEWVLVDVYVPTGVVMVGVFSNDTSNTVVSSILSAQGAPGAGARSTLIENAASNSGPLPVSWNLLISLTLEGTLLGYSEVTATCLGDPSSPHIAIRNTFGPEATEEPGATEPVEPETTETIRPLPVGTPAFSGPPLPINRNLVLMTSDSDVYSEPNGLPTGASVHRCQTAFVVETSEDDEWYRLYVMGGWIPAINTRDVAEDYGQSGSEVIDPSCQ